MSKTLLYQLIVGLIVLQVASRAYSQSSPRPNSDGLDCICTVWHEDYYNVCHCCQDGNPSVVFTWNVGSCDPTSSTSDRSCRMGPVQEGEEICTTIDNCDDPIEPACQNGAVLHQGPLFMACGVIYFSHDCGDDCYVAMDMAGTCQDWTEKPLPSPCDLSNTPY